MCPHSCIGWNLAGTEHHGYGLGVEQRSVCIPGGERRIVGEDRAGARNHRVRGGPTAVHVNARGGASDPLARAIGGGGAAIETLCPLDRHVWASKARRDQPDAEQFLAGLAQQTAFNVNASIA